MNLKMPKPVESAGSNPYDQVILALVGQPSDRVRGDWHHYRCPACGDQSYHLGINQAEGRYRCLRCGIKGRIPSSGKSRMPAVFDKGPRSNELRALFSTEPDLPIDKEVADYMKRRKMPTHSEFTWCFGRGKALGHVVFPAHDIVGDLYYLQHRSIVDGAKIKYQAEGSAKPRLDFTPVATGRASGNVLILTEGPVDALMIRKLTGLWAAPCYGMNSVVNPLFVSDLSDAVDMVSLQSIGVMFDAEQMAEGLANSLSRRLRLALGIQVEPVVWPELDGIDPGDLRSQRRALTILESVL